MPSRPRRLSPTALRRYQACPRRFLWADLERRPRESELSPRLAVGNAVHHALERFYGLAESDRTIEILHRALRSVWPAHRDQAGFDNREEEAQWGRYALGLLDSFGTTFGIGGTPIARERWVRASVRGVALNTKLDRVDPASAGAAARIGGIEVIDYKTGRCKITAEDLASDPAVAIALVAAPETIKQPVVAVRYLFLADATEVIWQPDASAVNEARTLLEGLIAEICDPTNSFEPKPGEHCRFCPFALECPDRERVRVDDLAVSDEVPF